MASSKKRLAPRRPAESLTLRRSVWAGAGLLYLGAAAPLTAHAAPPLPTPCAGGACGTHATPTPFVTSGQAGVPVVNGQNMTVTQQSDRAILNWADFNIANGYSVTFAQPSATAQALNRIWSGDPSVIAGRLSANGQVMLVNQNGIVFDRGAQVNTGALTASTLNITDERFQAGLLAGTSANTRVFGDGVTRTGEVEVRAGAQLEAASGGRIMLLGSRVTNAGTIKTPDGQAILAAGKSVYVAASTDPALRGLLIEVDSSTIDAETGLPGQPDPTSSQVSNTGQISAPRGNVTVAALVVNQAGHVSATTSVSQNGSIYLLAGDTSSSATQPYSGSIDGRDTMLPNHGGTLTLAPGSVTEVVADPTDTGTITTQNEAQFIGSEVNLVGKTIVLQGDATVRAPAARVTINAAENPFGALVNPPATPDGSRVYLDAQSRIDASGLREVSVDATRNLLTVRLASNDLQDAPLQRDGFLRGRTVVVDARTGSTLFNIAPYAGGIKHSVQEELTRGGSISIRSAGDVITREGSSLDVSGGSIAYRGGMGAATTRLLGADGKAYDIGTAPADIQYVGFASSYNHLDTTWGVATSVTSQVLYSGYTDGADAGTLSVLGPNLHLRGIMEGFAFQDPYQRDPSGLTLGGALVIGDIRRRTLSEPQVDLRGPSLVFVDGLTDALGADFDPLTDALPSTYLSSAALSPQRLTEGGFNRITALSNGAISIDAPLRLSANGSFEAIGQSVTVNAAIDIAGGSIALQSTSRVGDALAPHDIVLGAQGSLDVSGRWTNDLQAAPGTPGSGAIVTNGGSVSLRAEDNVRLLDGSAIDVSGGAVLRADNRLVAGSAGSISLAADEDRRVPVFDGAVQIADGARLRGASFTPGKGGTLAIRSGTLTIGDVARESSGELVLDESFFNDGTGGFSRYDLTGIFGASIGAAGDAVHLQPVQQVLGFTGNANLTASGTDLDTFTGLQRPLDERSVAVGLSLGSSATRTASGTPAPGIGDVVLAEGSSIVTGPGGAISLAVRGSLGSLDVMGDLTAPGGSIRLQLASQAATGADYGFIDLANGGYVQQLRLGSHADLDARGVARVSTLNALGLRQGSVLDGGSVSLLANKGFIVTEAGSTIDVSATSAVLDLANGTGFTATSVAGDAGTIAIDAREGLSLDGTLRGRAAAAPGSGGGTLSIGLGAVPGVPGNTVGTALYDHSLTGQFNDNFPASPYPTAPRVLRVTSASAASIPEDLQSGSATISTDTLGGGFDNLAIKSGDVVEFSDSMALRPAGSLTVDAPILRVGDGALVKLAGSRVALGYSLNAPGATQSMVDPFRGTVDVPALGANAGRLVVGDESTLVVDVRGSSVLQNVATARIQSAGDVRLSFAGISSTVAPYASGSLYTSGDLVFAARQVYPTSATRFDLYSPGTVSFGSLLAATPTTVPLSAGGDLRVTAHRIEQTGVLRAPLGSIRLTAQDRDGENGRVTLAQDSLTSVSADGVLLPFGVTINGIQYAYNFSAGDITLVGSSDPDKAAIPLPDKQIRIEASEVVIDKDPTGAGHDARLDLSGGGDLYAYEFIAGPGGSRDVLNPGAGRYAYAILPSLGSGASPLDLQYQSGTNIPLDRSVVIKGVPGLPDGTYTLLPARYALMPGAFAVQVVAADSDAAMSSAVMQPDGSFLAAARLATAGTSQIDSRTSTIRLTPGSVVRTQSQYNETGANAFFSNHAATNGTVAPPLPADAGQLQLAATVALELGRAIDFGVGQFVTGTGQGAVTHQGIGGVVSIVAPRIAVTDPGAAAVAGQLQLDADALNELGAQTLILGATRESSTLGDRLVIGSDEVVVGNSAAHALEGAEIILAAGDAVTLDGGSAVTATGTGTGARKPLVVDADGAVLRASTGAAVSLLRTVTTPADATLSIADGAQVTASGSLLLDAAGSTAIAAGAQVKSPDLTLSSSRVNLGDVPAGTPGLNLTTGLLDVLDAGGLQRLRLNSAQSIDLYGPVQLGAVSGAGAPQLELLQLNGGALLGHGDGDKVLSAGRVELGNAARVTVGASGDGTGALHVRAIGTSTPGSGVVALRDGDLAVRGFGSGTATAVTVQADRELRLAGDGSLSLDVDGGLLLRTPRIAGDTGAAQRIEHSSGRVDIAASPLAAGVVLPEAGLGASLEIVGTTINQAGTLELPAGVVRLEATAGDLTLAAGSATRANGASRVFFDTPAAAPAGRIDLRSRTGDVVIAQGATVDVSAAQTAHTLNLASAGTLDVHATQGAFVADGALLGHAAEGGEGANVRLDVGRLASFDTLNTTLAQGGFSGRNELRVRTGDVNASASTTVDASRFVLSADQGAIRFAGRIDTGGGTSLGPDGGAISLWAAKGVDVSGATLDTHAAPLETGERPGRGGDIDIGSRDGALALGGATFIQTGAGRLADASADTTTHGVLTLRTPRTSDAAGSPTVAITGGDTVALATTRTVVIEGSRVYQATRLGTDADDGANNLSIGTDGAMFLDAQTFSAAAPQIAEAVFGSRAASLPVQVRAGVEVQSSDDLVLASDWDLAAWRAAGAPVNLGLRAAGDLDLSGSISDGFTNNGGAPATWTFGATGDAASYRLVAGADLAAADPMSVRPAAELASSGQDGKLVLRADHLVRTGTGSIALGAAGDLVLESQTSVIYTAGSRAAALDDFPSPVKARSFNGPFDPAYSTGGGNVSIDVGGDIASAPSAQLVSDWMWRRGRVPQDGTIAAGQNTSWWTMFDRFQQGVATFGGGALDVRAGGDIRNLSAAVASNGRLAGATGTLPLAENLSVNGGGQLSVQAGGDILSGVFEVDWGNARVHAGGDIASGRIVGDTNPVFAGSPRGDAAVNSIFVLGYGAGTVDVNAGGDLHLDAALNSTATREASLNRTAVLNTPRAYFYTLDADSRLDLVSTGGDVDIDNHRGPVGDMARDGTYDASTNYDAINLSVYPPNVNAIALSGDLRSSELETLPAAGVSVNLLARDTVSPGAFTVRDGDPARLANVLRPAVALTGVSGNLETVPRPVTPLHQGDTSPIRIVAQMGDIDGGLVTLPKPARIVAGNDIVGLDFNGKNLGDRDVTLLMAGGDIQYTTATNARNELVSNNSGIEVEGPGYIEVLAGGDVNLGNSLGIVSSGNLGDVRLPNRGASILVGAGFGKDAAGGQRAPAYPRFTDAYLAPRADGTASLYTADLIAYVAALQGVSPNSLDAAAALTAFRALPATLQLPLAAKVLTKELSQTGLDHSRLGTDYERGYQAIRTLFPEKDAQDMPLVYDGDINMFFSQIKTQQGGDINLLAPGGSVVVGLPNPPPGLAGTKVTAVAGTSFTVPAEANLGLLVLASGAIGGFASDSFIVNQSRILTLQGGDIILWASEGDIDAGRGAKSASGAPPPVIQTDEKGNVFVNPIGAVSGSGIGQLLTVPGIVAGLVNLIAPKGDVNAGEAGIRVAGNLNIAAVRVIGADNISVSGTSSGVPVSDAGALSGALSGANALGDAGKNASDQLSRNLANAAADGERLASALKPAFVIVKLFCLGDECEIRQ